MIKKWLQYHWWVLKGLVVNIPLVIYCEIKGLDKFPEYFKYYDNEEFGYHGDKTGFLSDYLGFDVNSKNFFLRCWYKYQHSAIRNPVFNIRLNPDVAIDLTKITDVVFEGNTFHHSAEYSFEPEVNDEKWYNITFKYEGEEYYSKFRLSRVRDGKYTYKRWGIKMYPADLYDPWWIEKNKKEGIITNRRYGIANFMWRRRSV